MSLINDALRKARLAAAEHEDQRNTSRASKAYPSRRPRQGVGLGAVATVAVLAAMTGAAFVWWFTSSPKPREAHAVEAPAPATPDEAAQPQTEPTAPAEAAGEAEARPAKPTAVPRELVSQPDPMPEQAVPGVEEAPSSPPPEAPPGSTDRVFVIDADLGYATLSLGYIVHRKVRPFAEINGVDVYEGSEVAGFTVEKIEIDRVILRDGRGPLELRVP